MLKESNTRKTRTKEMRLILLAIVLVFFQTVGVEAQGNGRVGIIDPWVEMLIFLFLIIAVIVNALLIRKHKTDVWKPFLIFLLAGIVLMIFSRIVIVAFDLGIFKIDDETLAMWWHLMFYLGMVSFFIALKKIMTVQERSVKDKSLNFGRVDVFILVTLGVLALAVFLSAEPLDAWFVSWFSGSFFAEIGLQHFVAFLFAGFIAAQLAYVRFFISKEVHDTRDICSLSGSLLIFLALISANHFWELITESWVVINLSLTTIETVEQVFWLPASIFLSYGLWKTLWSKK